MYFKLKLAKVGQITLEIGTENFSVGILKYSTVETTSFKCFM